MKGANLIFVSIFRSQHLFYFLIQRRKQKAVDEKSGILMNEPSSSKTEGLPSNGKDTAASAVEDQPSTSSKGAPESDVEKIDEGAIREHQANGGTTPEAMGDHDARWSGRTVSPSQVIKEVFFWQIVALIFLDNVAVIYVSSLYKV